VTKLLEQVIEKLRKLPEAEQNEAAELLLNLVARRYQPIELDADTRSAVEEGLAQVERGDVVSEEEMGACFRRLGV
jgi:predicted transcriptional regulator